MKRRQEGENRTIQTLKSDLDRKEIIRKAGNRLSPTRKRVITARNPLSGQFLKCPESLPGGCYPLRTQYYRL